MTLISPFLIGLLAEDTHRSRWGAARSSGVTIHCLQSIIFMAWLPIKYVWVKENRKRVQFSELKELLAQEVHRGAVRSRTRPDTHALK